MLRSPCSWAGSRLSLGKGRMVLRCSRPSGRRARSGRRRATRRGPSTNATCRAGMLAPSIPLSSVGRPVRGLPAARRRTAVVDVRVISPQQVAELRARPWQLRQTTRRSCAELRRRGARPGGGRRRHAASAPNGRRHRAHRAETGPTGRPTRSVSPATDRAAPAPAMTPACRKRRREMLVNAGLSYRPWRAGRAARADPG